MYEDIRDRVQAAYRILRKKGYRCRSNFSCCQSCAWAELGDEEKVVFWHRQDTDSARYRGELYLAWDGDVEEIGQALREQGLQVEVPPRDTLRFKVSLPEEQEAAA